MIERFYKNDAIAERLKKSVLGPHLDTFVSVISDLGYSPSTIRTQLEILASLTRWIQKNDLDICHIDENITNRFLFETCRKGALRKGEKNTLRRFLSHLQTEGIVDCPVPTFDNSPLTSLKHKYEHYLLKERGLSAVTSSRYWVVLKRFVLERFGEGPLLLCDLGQQDVDSFLLRHARESTPKIAQLMVTSMRSFFRFLTTRFF